MIEPTVTITPELTIKGTVRVYGKRMSFHASGQWASALRPETAVRIRGFDSARFPNSVAEVSRRDYLGDNVYRIAVWRSEPRKK